MSVSYRAVQWNRQKKVYDLTLAGGVVLYLAVFLGAGFLLHPEATAETMLIRALGTAALLLLHVILVIGPLCRLDRRFLPLLYNRRHLGVTTFFLALAHGVLSLVQFHALGDLDPLVSLWVSDAGWGDGLAAFPFQPLGFLALVVLFLMAATSHDFWLANLTAPVWKSLHMMVYVAYALVVMHVALGTAQTESSPFLAGLLGVAAAGVLGFHVAAGFRERGGDREAGEPGAEGYVDVGAVAEIAEKRAKVVTLAGERVAVFRYDGKVSAISNVCQHQNGPLGEGKVVDGLVVCPWHGYQYQPDCGASPEPFTEKVPTFRTRVVGGRVWIDPRPLPPGTPVPPARIDGGGIDGGAEVGGDDG